MAVEVIRSSIFEFESDVKKLRRLARKWGLHNSINFTDIDDYDDDDDSRCPFYYLVDYYPVNKEVVETEDIWKNRWLVWDFKCSKIEKWDPLKHASANSKIYSAFISKLQETFGEYCKDLTLFFVPTSKKEDYSRRYGMFNTFLMNNNFPVKTSYHNVHFYKDSKPKHLGGNGMPEVGISCVKGAKIIIIDDVLTSGKTVQRYVWKLESLGASVIGCMVVGKTV